MPASFLSCLSYFLYIALNAKGRPNPTAKMRLFTSPNPVTLHKKDVLQIAAMESGCTPIESTFVFQSTLNIITSLKLDYSSKI